MCLAFLLESLVPGVSRILMFNRDEDFERLSLPAHCWGKRSDIIAGYDRSSGGTWAGITRGGRFGMLTFVREPRLPRTPSRRRGEIVRNFLFSDDAPEVFAYHLLELQSEYLGYNVVLGDRSGVVHYNNRSGNNPSRLGPGLHGLSNADLNTPWFKVERGKALIESELQRGAFDAEHLMRILADRLMPADEEVQHTGLAFDREKLKSPLFVAEPDYGTRSSSVVMFHEDGAIDFYERSYAASARVIGEVHWSLKKVV